MSISAPSVDVAAGGALRENGHFAVERHEGRAAVGERHVLAAMADVRRVDLEIHEQDVRPACPNVTELEGQTAVRASLADRARLDRVDRDSLGPARIEDQDRLLEVAARVDAEARHVQKPTA